MTASAAETTGAGRVCPRDYRYAPSVFDRPAELHAEVLYVVGGLHGNLAALDAIEALAAREAAPVTIVFNGDFHWFDAELDWFTAVDDRVARGVITRIATQPSPHPPLYGLARDGVCIDALPVHDALDAFLPAFLSCWYEGSPARRSYLRRIEHGPDHTIAAAVLAPHAVAR